jgi:uncharacterized protein with PQ loop repeat
MNTLFGMIALVTSIVVALVGFPSQIYINYKRKSTDGFSLIFCVAAIINSIAWFSYGMSKPEIDWFIVLANIMGIVLLSMLLFQFFIYGKKKLKQDARSNTNVFNLAKYGDQ